MIGISEIAVTKLVESLQAIGVESQKGLRLYLRGNQPVLKIDKPKKNDRLIMHNGQIALIVDKAVGGKIGNAFIDIEGDPVDPYLSIRRNILNNDE
jgi:hypothetical protein